MRHNQLTMSSSPRRVAAPRPLNAAASDCSVLRTLELIGDYWTLGVLRCAIFGLRRFGDFERELGIASNVLANRLERLVSAEVLRRVPYQHRPLRHEYVLTERGRELEPVVIALKTWGDRHVRPDGPATRIRHTTCEAPVEVVARCPDCGAVPAAGELIVDRLSDPAPY